MGGQTISTSATRVESLNIQSSARGAALPWLRGVTSLPGNMIWYGRFASIAHTTKQSGGKGGVTQKNTTYTYTTDTMLGLGHGCVYDVPRIWRDKEVFSGGASGSQMATVTEAWALPASGVQQRTVAQPGGFLAVLAIVAPGGQALAPWRDYSYTGGGAITVLSDAWRGQTVSVVYQRFTTSINRMALGRLNFSLLQGHIGQPVWSGVVGLPDASLPYSGIAAVAASAYDLGENPRLPNHQFEVISPWAYHLGPTVPDIDPAMFLRELALDAKAGGALPARYLGDWQAWSDYCVAANLLISPALTERTTLRDVFEQAADLTNTAIVATGGAIRMVPLGDAVETANGRTYTPDLTPLFDLDDECYVPRRGEPPLRYRWLTDADRPNRLSVEFRNRANAYAPEPATVKDDTDIRARGLIEAQSPIRGHWFCDAARASRAANLRLQRGLAALREWEFALPVHYSQINLASLLTLTDQRLGLLRHPVRVTKIGESGDDGSLLITARDYPIGSASAPAFGPPDGVGHQPDYNADPGSATAPLMFEAPADLASTGLEVYIATSGSGADYGGCQVWLSLDGVSNYKLAGTVYGNARRGYLAAAASASATTVSVGGFTGPLTGGSPADVDALATLCYVGTASGGSPEYMAYTSATLTGPGEYTVAGLVRSAYETPANGHVLGEAFVRVDEAIVKTGPLDIAMVGKTIYVKCCSFNRTGGRLQSLADVSATAYTITGALAALKPGINGKGVNLRASSLLFSHPSGGGVAPSTISLTADRKGGLTGGAVVWSVVAGSATITGSGDARTLTAANLTSTTATIRASVTDAVATYTDDVTISHVYDGADGAGSVVWVTRGALTQAGTSFTKTGTTAAWDADAYTATPFVGGAYAAFTPAQNNAAFMVALNTDPATDNSYPGLDYAMYCRSDGALYAFESGVGINLFASYTAGQAMMVRYFDMGADGGRIDYIHAGTIRRTVSVASGLTFYADSSFHGPGARADNMVFGPVGIAGPQGPQGDVGDAGASAPLMWVKSTAQAFTFDGSGAALPTSQTLTFDAQLQNLSGTATWSCTRYSDTGASLGAVTLGGSGNTRTLTVAQFGAAQYADITASLSGLTDVVRVIRVKDGAGVVAVDLSNDNHTLPATSDGTVTSYAGAQTQIVIREGLVDATASWTITPSASSGVTYTRVGSVFTITGVSPSIDVNFLYLQPTKAGMPTPMQSVMKLTKTRSAPNATGPINNYFFSISHTPLAPAPATASIKLSSIGTVFGTHGSTDVLGSWYIPSTSGIGANYEHMATLASGTPPTGDALGVWIDGAAEPQWSISATSGQGYRECVLYIKTRLKSSGLTVANGNLNIAAESVL